MQVELFVFKLFSYRFFVFRNITIEKCSICVDLKIVSGENDKQRQRTLFFFFTFFKISSPIECCNLQPTPLIKNGSN